jgi:ATP:ADP antiporter, AAA family
MSSSSQPEFGPIRSFLWPIYSFELKKLLPMFLIFFCTLFNYTVMRDMKDSLVVTNCGAAAIPFLKIFGVLPGAIIYMLFYAKLSNKLDKESLFYAAIVPFLVFFGLFPTVIFPYKEFLHLPGAASFLSSILPAGIAIQVSGAVENWTFSLFYIMAELWGSAVVSLLFWGFANEITRATEAKRFYSLFGIGGQSALILSGMYITWAATLDLPPEVATQVSLNYMMAIVVVLGFVIMAAYYWMNRNVLTDKRFYDPADVKKKKSKPKLGMLESFKYLAKSKHILCIAVLVIAYGIGINLVEVTWKNQLKLQYPNTNDYVAFMGRFSQVVGVVTFFLYFIGGYVIRRFGWLTGALATPVMLLVTGIAFFAFVIYRESFEGVVAMLGTTPLMLAVGMGAAQNIVSKSTKYSLFDPTKEMSYIPLDQESKVKGKAAIDVVGARLGKSGGAMINAFLIAIFGSISGITPALAIVLAIVMAAWMYSSVTLSGLLSKIEKENEASAAKIEEESTKAAS